MKREEFTFGDAWVLASVSAKPAELWEVIMAGDVLNHAILKREEIIQGLVRGQHWGLVSVHENRFALTPLGQTIITSIHGGLFVIVLNLQKKLNSSRTKFEWVSEVNDCSFLSEAVVESAYQQYRSVARSDSKKGGV